MKGCYVYFYNQALAHHFMHQLQPQQEEKKEFVLNPKSMTMQNISTFYHYTLLKRPVDILVKEK